jgi:hypothetical protein
MMQFDLRFWDGILYDGPRPTSIRFEAKGHQRVLRPPLPPS